MIPTQRLHPGRKRRPGRNRQSQERAKEASGIKYTKGFVI